MKYYLAFVLTSLLAITISHTSGEHAGAILAGELIATIVLTVAGILICHELNRRGDDRDFVNRMVCLGWPVCIRVAAIMVPAHAIYLAVGLLATGHSFAEFADEPNVADVVASVVCGVISWSLMALAIGWTSRVDPPVDAQPVAAERRLSRERNLFLAAYVITSALSVVSLFLAGRRLPPSVTRDGAIVLLLSTHFYFPFFAYRFAGRLGLPPWARWTWTVLALPWLLDVVALGGLLVSLSHARRD
jgi:hypothetical protein